MLLIISKLLLIKINNITMKKLGILLIVLFTANSGPMFSQKNELNYKNLN